MYGGKHPPEEPLRTVRGQARHPFGFGRYRTTGVKVQLEQVMKRVASNHLPALALDNPPAHPPPHPHPRLLINSILSLNSLLILLLMTRFWTGQRTSLRGTGYSTGGAMPEEDMEEVGTPTGSFGGGSYNGGGPATDDRVSISLYGQPYQAVPAQPAQPPVSDGLDHGTCTVCTTRTLEMLQYLFLATQAHCSSLQCKAPSLNSFPPLEGPTTASVCTATSTQPLHL